MFRLKPNTLINPHTVACTVTHFKVSTDDRTLIREFVDGFYGAAAAPFIHLYMDLVHGSIADTGTVIRSYTHTVILSL